MDIDKINTNFYNTYASDFDHIPFKKVLPTLLDKYLTGDQILEVGIGTGKLASWLQNKGFEVTCIEPAKKLADIARNNGLQVHLSTLQNFDADTSYDSVIAISSLIHIPKGEIPAQLEKIAKFLKPQKVFFMSVLLGKTSGLEDPTNLGQVRYFSKWEENEIRLLLSKYFVELESHQIHSRSMDRTFLLGAYQLKD